MQCDRIHLLLIEDDPVDVESVRRVLRQELEAGVRCDLEHASTLREGLDLLGKKDIDAVLLDLHLPDSRGVVTVARLRDANATVPIVVFTGARDQATALRALQSGAQDFLTKDELSIPSALTRSVRYAMERQRMMQENRALTSRLARTEKMASLGVIAAGVAVGFNQLLGTVLDEADCGLEILDGELEPDRLRRSFNAIRLATLRAGRMASQLRDYAVAENGPLQTIVLSEFVVEMSEYLGKMVGPKIEIHYELDAQSPVRARRLQLHQLLLSLTLNAAEAIGTGPGHISISSGSREVKSDLLQQCEGSPDAQAGIHSFLRVSDDGCGISPAVRDRIFDPFYSTKAAGRGLGLAAVLGILRDLRGSILVESRVGEGSAFTVLLPSERANTANQGDSQSNP